MSMNVQEIMTRNPLTLRESDMAIEAARIMREQGIGDVVVVKEDGDLCGMVTDRDLVTRVMAEGGDAAHTELGSICSREPMMLEPTSTVDEAEELMRRGAIRRLPVCEGRRPIGIVTLGDIARAGEEHVLGAISSAPPSP